MLISSLAIISCSKDDDPKDNDLFVGTYKGAVSYKKGDEVKKIDDGRVTVIKVNDKYTFDFSDGIPSIKDVEFEEGKGFRLKIGIGDTSVIKIDQGNLTIMYISDGATWTANCKR